LPPIPIPIVHSGVNAPLPKDPGPPPDIDLPPTPPSALSLFSALSKSWSKAVGGGGEGAAKGGLEVSEGGKARSRKSSRPSSWIDNEDGSQRALRS
jgi:hypothetical protein